MPTSGDYISLYMYIYIYTVYYHFFYFSSSEEGSELFPIQFYFLYFCCVTLGNERGVTCTITFRYEP